MKALTTCLFLISCITTTFSQVVAISENEYQLLKENGELDPTIHYQIYGNSSSNWKQNSTHLKNGICDCLVTIDSTFQLAMLPNDDFSSDPIALPFVFDFYGNNYDSVYINNNGNISFVAAYPHFTANSFPDNAFNMIAPFWADVDTRSVNSGMVWYKLTPSALIVVWENVGYYAEHEDKLSTFQLILSNGLDSLIPNNNNVSFCYGDMQWTTGDASGGVAGFGGVPATVGVNIGNGIDYFQIGQFDAPGTTFDGPYMNIDQVDFLDNQEIYFSLAGSSNNIPPIIVSSIICDTIDVYTGDTLQKSPGVLQFDFTVFGPENNQSISANLSCSLPSAFSYVSTAVSNECTRYTCTFDANGVTPGIYEITINAEDNGTLPATSEKTVMVSVHYQEGLGLKEETTTLDIWPNPTSSFVYVSENICDVEIFSINGRKLMHLIETNGMIDLSSLSDGTYLLRASTAFGTIQHRIQKQTD